LIKDFAKYSDAELIKILSKRRGDANDAFNEIYSRYSNRFYSYCYFKFSDTAKAEEYSQEGWMGFVEAINQKKTIGNIFSFLIGTVNKLHVNISKQKSINSRMEEQIGFDNLSNSPDPFRLDLDLENKDYIEKVKAIINAMDEKYKEVLIMYWFEDLNIIQIAETLNETTACIYKRFSRAYQHIIDLIKELEKTKEF